jgi:hypothetical protein
VTELTPEETENPLGGYGRTISHVVIGLKTTKGSKQVGVYIYVCVCLCDRALKAIAASSHAHKALPALFIVCVRVLVCVRHTAPAGPQHLRAAAEGEGAGRRRHLHRGACVYVRMSPPSTYRHPSAHACTAGMYCGRRMGVGALCVRHAHMPQCS